MYDEKFVQCTCILLLTFKTMLQTVTIDYITKTRIAVEQTYN